MKKFIKYYYTIILYTWSFIDVFTGFNLHNEIINSINLSQILRSLLLFISLVIIFLKSEGYLKNFITFITLFLLLLFCKLIYYKYPFDYLYLQIKTFGWLYNVFAFYLLYKNKILKYQIFKNALFINFLVIFFNIILGYFGFGFSKYGEDIDGSIIGSIGYFYSGNELNSALFICFSSFYFIYRNSFSSFIKLSILFLFVTFATLSKSIIGGYFFITLVSLFLLHNRFNLKYFILTLFFGATVFLVLNNITFINLYLESFSYLYDRSDTFFDFISNGRSQRFNAFEITHFFSNLNKIIIGTYHPDNNIFTFEMDYLDVLFYNGIIGLLILYFCWKFLLKLISKNLQINERRYIIYTILFYNLIAFFAGHTLYSQMSLLFLIIFVIITHININTIKISNI